MYKLYFSFSLRDYYLQTLNGYNWCGNFLLNGGNRKLWIVQFLTIGFIAWFNNNHARLLEFENYRGYKGIFNRRNTPKGHYDVRWTECFILGIILTVTILYRFNQLQSQDSSSLSEAETWTHNPFSFNWWFPRKVQY